MDNSAHANCQVRARVEIVCVRTARDYAACARSQAEGETCTHKLSLKGKQCGTTICASTDRRSTTFVWQKHFSQNEKKTQRSRAEIDREKQISGKSAREKGDETEITELENEKNVSNSRLTCPWWTRSERQWDRTDPTLRRKWEWGSYRRRVWAAVQCHARQSRQRFQ